MLVMCFQTCTSILDFSHCQTVVMQMLKRMSEVWFPITLPSV
jgi:hypothetical protein